MQDLPLPDSAGYNHSNESNVFVQWVPSFPRRTPNFAYVAWQVVSNPLFADTGYVNVPEQATAYPLCQYHVEHHGNVTGNMVNISSGQYRSCEPKPKFAFLDLN